MKRLIPIAALGLIACTTTPESGSGPCRADGLGNLVGRNATAALGVEAQRRSGARQVRWIRPGDAVTMDFRPDRLNIRLDASGRVESFACG